MELRWRHDIFSCFKAYKPPQILGLIALNLNLNLSTRFIYKKVVHKKEVKKLKSLEEVYSAAQEVKKV